MIASSLFSSFRGIPLERGVCSGGLHREKVSKDKPLDFCSGIEKETKIFRLAETVQFSLLFFFGVWEIYFQVCAPENVNRLLKTKFLAQLHSTGIIYIWIGTTREKKGYYLPI